MNVIFKRYEALRFYLFPVGKNKIPYKDFKWRELSSDEPSDWEAWELEYPGCAWAIDCGKSGLIVVDVDPRNGGADSFALHLRGMPKTWEVKTPSGGKHYYFKGKLHSSKPWPGVDVKAEGGYVLCPPSENYTWLFSDGFLTEFPKNRPTAFDEKKKEKFTVPEKIAEGTRDETLFKQACSLVGQNLRPEFIQEVIAKSNVEICQPPLDEKQLQKVILSAEKKRRKQESKKIKSDDSIFEFERNDHGNAERLYQWFKDDFIFTSRGWHYWEGHRWSAGGLDGIRTLRISAAKQFKKLLSIVDRSQKEIHRYFLQCGNIGSLNAAIQIAEKMFRRETEIFDANPLMLNFNNGTYDLQAMEFKLHNRLDYITKTTGYDYVESTDEACPYFQRLIVDSMSKDLEKAEFLFRYLGYCLTGCNHEEIVLLNHGYGNNGKTTLSNVMLKVMGDYATSANIQTFLESKQSRGMNPRPDLMALIGARFVCAGEPPKGQGLDEALLKQLVGGDEKAERNCHDREMTRFRPILKLFLSYNIEPTIKDSGFGFWKRVCKLNWDVKFQRDEMFKAKVSSETQAIACCLIRACKRWQESGLMIPLSVRQSTDEYASEQDEVRQFVDECLDIFDGTSLSNSDLWKAWTDYCRSEGVDMRTKKYLGSSLKQLGHRQCSGRKKERRWDKLSVKRQIEDNEERSWQDDV